MTATYFGCPILGIEHVDTATQTATIVVHLPESVGPERFEDVPLTQIEVWPDFIDHGAGTCACIERAGTSHSGARPDASGDGASGLGETP